MTREQIAASFGAELAKRFGAAWGCLWDAKIQRYVVTGRSAAGYPTREVFGWFYDPNVSSWNPDTLRFEHPVIPVDRETGLPPFRELDAQAQAEIIDAMEKTYLANRHDGAGTWQKQRRQVTAHNEQRSAAVRRQDAVDYADMLSEFDLRRPWLKHWSRNQVERRIANGIRGG